MRDKIRERFYTVFNTTNDYQNVKLTEEQRESIIDGITEEMDFDEIETYINKQLIKMGYEFNINNWLWERDTDKLLEELRAVLRKYGL
jgi:hypothetical protein